MITLHRAVRIRENIDMPSGKRIEVNCNLEESLPDILNAYAVVNGYAERLRGGENIRDEFYDAYADFLAMIIGKSNWKTIEEEFEGYRSEMCEAIAPWVNDTVIPAIAEASHRRLQKRMHGK